MGPPTREWLSALMERAAPPLASPPAPPASALSTLVHQVLARLPLPAPSPEALAATLLAAALLAAVLLPRAAAAVAAWRRWLRIPGPPAPHLLLGHAPVLNSDRAPMELLAHAERYGDLFRVRLAHRRCVVVGSPEVFAALVRRGVRNPLPKDASVYAPLDVGIEGRPKSMLTELHESSPLWKSLRQAVAPAFSATSLRARVFPPLRDAIAEVCAHLEAEWERAAAFGAEKVAAAVVVGGGGGGSGSGGGERRQQHQQDANGAPPPAAPGKAPEGVELEVDVEDMAKRLTADVINLLLFGEPLGGVRAFCSRPLPAAGSCGTEAAAREADARASAAADLLLRDPDAKLTPDQYTALVEALLGTARRALGNPFRRPLAPLLRLLGDADARLDDRLERGFAAMMKARSTALVRDPPPEGSLARAMMGAFDPSTGEKVSDRRLESELSVVLNAGFETTSRAIVCTMAALAEHPRAQERLAGELARAGLARAADAAAAEDPAPPLTAGAGAAPATILRQMSRAPSAFAAAAAVRPIEWADLSPQALPYLHAVLRESLRLWPPAALGTGRVVAAASGGGVGASGGSGISSSGAAGLAPAKSAASADDADAPSSPHPGDAHISGHSVPPGTIVLLPVFVCGRRTSVYGSDAAEFRPERWLDLPPGASPPPEAPAFSLGPRDCVGQSLARVELAAAVAALVGAFRWRPAARLVEAGGLEGSLCYRITLGTASGMPLLFSPRR